MIGSRQVVEEDYEINEEIESLVEHNYTYLHVRYYDQAMSFVKNISKNLFTEVTIYKCCQMIPNHLHTLQHSQTNLQEQNLDEIIVNISGEKLCKITSKTSPEFIYNTDGDSIDFFGFKLRFMGWYQQNQLDWAISYEGKITIDNFIPQFKETEYYISFENFNAFCKVIGESRDEIYLRIVRNLFKYEQVEHYCGSTFTIFSKFYTRTEIYNSCLIESY